MWIWLASVASAQSVPDLGFATERFGVATSAAVARGNGVVLELQGQSLVLPGAVAPEGVDVAPVVPRLALGGTGGERTRWSAGVHGGGLVPSGVVGGGFASVAFGTRGVWSGFELDGSYATSIADTPLDHLAVNASSVIAGDVDTTTTLFLRFGGAGTLSGDDELVVSPRAGFGVGYRPHSSAVLGLSLHGALRADDPRVPWAAALTLAWRFGDVLAPPEPKALVVQTSKAPIVEEVQHPLLVCEEGQISTGAPPPFGRETWCVVITEDQQVVRQGPYLRWHDAKNVAERGQYDDGRRTGDWQEIHRSGFVGAEGAYVKDLKHGPWKMYFPNGSLDREGAFWNGKEDGEWTYHRSDGGRLVGSWEAGSREGEWLVYDDRGHVTQKLVYKDGMQVHREMVSGVP